MITREGSPKILFPVSLKTQRLFLSFSQFNSHFGELVKKIVTHISYLPVNIPQFHDF
jgi:hypothetical protein